MIGGATRNRFTGNSANFPLKEKSGSVERFRKYTCRQGRCYNVSRLENVWCKPVCGSVNANLLANSFSGAQ